MRKLITPEDMRSSEAGYFGAGRERSIEVMERAARALADCALGSYPEARRICVVCGPGGNGGDGYACARMLLEAGRQVLIAPCGPARSADARENEARARKARVPFLTSPREAERIDLWIDCVYGTGLSRPPEGAAAEWIAAMNRGPAPVLACDIPSGLNGRTGRAFEGCVRADRTLTLQRCKTGLLLGDGPDICGEIQTADIGFPGDIFPPHPPLCMEPEDLRGLFAPRPRNIHKGRCGHLLILAGSFGMAGAAALCARGALRSGAGLVTIACPERIVPILQTLVPCAMCLPLPEEGAGEVLEEALRGKSAVCIGCGLTREAPAELLKAVLKSGLPAVIDADALNILSAHPELIPLLNGNHVLTPHPGEAARLLGHPCADPLSDARELSRMGCCAVLKGATRVICAGDEVYISTSGDACMARGGSGDIYAGILGALLAEHSKRSMAESAGAACELHGLCGVRAGEKYGRRAANSGDLLEFLPEVFKAYVE